MTAQMLSKKSSLSSEKTLWSDKGSKSEVLANIYNKEKKFAKKGFFIYLINFFLIKFIL